jgi:integrase
MPTYSSKGCGNAVSIPGCPLSSAPSVLFGKIDVPRRDRTVNRAGVRWHGWQASRRGRATNLHRLGVPDKTIQRILRHSNVAVTQSRYIKAADSERLQQ